jgi:hypothetical protein
MDQIARNTPGERFPALQMSPQAIDAELRRLPPQLLTMLRGELGLDRDGSPLGLADKARLMYAARHRMSMHDVARGHRPNAVPGSSGPQQQPPPGHPQLMQQQPPPGQQVRVGNAASRNGPWRWSPNNAVPRLLSFLSLHHLDIGGRGPSALVGLGKYYQTMCICTQDLRVEFNEDRIRCSVCAAVSLTTTHFTACSSSTVSTRPR